MQKKTFMVKCAFILFSELNESIDTEYIKTKYDFEPILFPNIHINYFNDLYNVEKLLNESIAKGAEVIISRGTIAFELNKMLKGKKISLIEIKHTNYELYQALKKAKSLTNKKKPRIAFMAPENMYMDFSVEKMEEDLEIKLEYYPIYYSKNESHGEKLQEIIASSPDAFVGGKQAIFLINQYNIPGVNVNLTNESLENVYRSASSTCFAIELRKNNIANLRSVLNYTMNGIIQFDKDGNILLVNRFVEHLVFKSYVELVGHSIFEYIEGINKKTLLDTINKEKELSPLNITVNHINFIASLTPVIKEGDNATTGLLAIYEGKQINLLLNNQSSIINHKNFSQMTFDQYINRSRYTKTLLSKAKNLVNNNLPFLFIGKDYNGQEELVNCIYNEKYNDTNYSFINFDCRCYTEKEIDEYFWSKDEKGIFENSINGLIYIQHIEYINKSNQYRLAEYIRNNLIDHKNINIDLTIICSISSIENRKNIIDELWLLLNIGRLDFIDLKERKSDIDGYIEQYINEYQEKYHRIIHINKEGYNLLQNYDWPNNLLELKNVIEKIYINCSTNNITKDDIAQFIRSNLEIYSKEKNNNTKKIKSSSKEEIVMLLNQYNGNRTIVASKLGISTTTLWRKLKKYNIEENK